VVKYHATSPTPQPERAPLPLATISEELDAPKRRDQSHTVQDAGAIQIRQARQGLREISLSPSRINIYKQIWVDFLLQFRSLILQLLYPFSQRRKPLDVSNEV
jgi:hypothetical protein